MRKLLLIFTIATGTLWSCNPNRENTTSEKKDDKSILLSDTFIPSSAEFDTTHNNQDSSFLNLFTEYTEDSLSISPLYGPDIKNTRFEGRLIGQNMRHLFRSIDNNKDNFEYYACLKFRFTNNLMALIIRTPSDGANALTLYFYDLAKHKLFPDITLGAQFGDMGVMWNERATLHNISSNLKIIRRLFYLEHDNKSFDKYKSIDSTYIYEKQNEKLVLVKSQLDKKLSGSY